MRSIVIGAVMFAVTLSAAAEGRWKVLGDLSLDTKTITRNGPIVKVWYQLPMTPEQKEDFARLGLNEEKAAVTGRYRVSINCSQHTYQMLSWSWLNERGAPVGTSSGSKSEREAKKNDIQPESNMEALEEAVCEQR